MREPDFGVSPMAAMLLIVGILMDVVFTLFDCFFFMVTYGSFVGLMGIMGHTVTEGLGDKCWVVVNLSLSICNMSVLGKLLLSYWCLVCGRKVLVAGRRPSNPSTCT